MAENINSTENTQISSPDNEHFRKAASVASADTEAGEAAGNDAAADDAGADAESDTIGDDAAGAGPDAEADATSEAATGDDETAGDDGHVCKNCGSPSVLEGYTIPLCSECRQKFMKYPVPKSIKVFSTIMLAIMVFSLLSFSKSLNAGIAYERGLRAEKEAKFNTAVREYKKVTEIFPESFIACGKLFVAYVKNYQLDEAIETFELIEGKESSNSDEVKVIDQANEALGILDAYYNLNQELVDIYNLYTDAPLQTKCEKLKGYVAKYPDDFMGFYTLGDTLFDLEAYEDAKSAYLQSISLRPDLYMLRLGVAAVYRQTGEFEKAIAECNTVLEYNKESAEAYASLSKIDLKRHLYESALQLANKAYEYDGDSINSVYTLTLAYHFNNKTEDRDSCLALLQALDPSYYDYAKSIIDGKSKLYE
ncbi:MAG: tetratricopeptide repeat protein [Clostridiaceae bacterium]